MNGWANPDSDFWIGLTDRDVEGTFVWESGHLLSTDIAAHWNPGQPDDGGGYEDCVEIKNNHKKLNDAHCSLKRAFVCQKPAGEQYEEKYKKETE